MALRGPLASVRAGAIAMLVAASAAIGLAGCGGGDDGKAAATTPAVAGVKETAALLKGVEQNNLELGDPKAPVTLLEVLDLQCPFCRKHELDVQPEIIDKLVRTGRVRIQMVPVAFLGPDSQRMEIVLLRLGRTNHAWDFANLVYWNQGHEGSGYATDAFLRRIVGAIPGTTDALASTTPDQGIAQSAQLSSAIAQAVVRRAGGGGTPFFAVAPTGTNLDRFTPILSGAPPDTYAKVLKAVEAVEHGKAPEPLDQAAKPSAGDA